MSTSAMTVTEGISTPKPASRPFVITFSGIDGGGKTTQIERLCGRLEALGYRVAQFSFWNHVVFLAEARAKIGDTQQASRAPAGNAIAKNNKNHRVWYLDLIRSGLYVLDTIRLRWLFRTARFEDYDFVIFDRYVYDQLATIYSSNALSRGYGRALLRLSPKPDLAILLDADPSAAFNRKPEYPLEFMYSYRKIFLALRDIIPFLVTIAPSGVEEVESNIAQCLSERLALQAMPVGSEQ